MPVLGRSYPAQPLAGKTFGVGGRWGHPQFVVAGPTLAPALLQAGAGSTGAATSFTTVTPALPGPAQPLSRILLFLVSDAVFTTPQGSWAALTSTVGSEQLSAWTLPAVGGESSWGAVTVTGATAWWVGEYAPVDAAQPDVAAASNNGSAVSTFATPTTAATTIPETAVVACWGISQTATNPADVTSTTNSFLLAAAGAAETSKASGVNVGVAVWQRIPAATGTFTTTATFSASINPASAIVALRGGPSQIQAMPELAMAPMS